MYRLLNFLYQYRALLYFLFLEIICGWLIVQNNKYQAASFFNSSNYMAGEVLKKTSQVKDYFNLKSVNEELVRENAILRERLAIEDLKKNRIVENRSDFLVNRQYKFVAAKVINNSINFSANYITLDRGTEDGILPGMGVISPKGVVGKVKYASDHFSTVISLLNDKWSISGKIKNKSIDGTVKWEGGSPRYAELFYVGRHHVVQAGDTIITSGYNPVFPEGILIGRIEKVEEDEGKPFWKITVALTQDFSSLSYVYAIENNLKPERDSLEQKTDIHIE